KAKEMTNCGTCDSSGREFCPVHRDAKQSEWIAYCAGLYEGEGTVHTDIRTKKAGSKAGLGKYERRYYRQSDSNVRQITLKIAMCDLIPLELFRDTMDAGNIRGPYKRSNDNWKDIYVYTIGSYKEILHVKDLIWPYLSERRKEQFEAEIDKYESFELKVKKE
ncbi:MAG: hypothetical protein ACREOB_11840, partial [Thermodesulfobacteriota bacterium]